MITDVLRFVSGILRMESQRATTHYKIPVVDMGAIGKTIWILKLSDTLLPLLRTDSSGRLNGSCLQGINQ